MPALSTSTLVAAYVTFLAISVASIALAARLLFRNGVVVLQHTFPAGDPLVQASMRLVRAAFLFLNLGFVSFLLLPRLPPNTTDQIAQFETDKCGAVLIALGFTSFLAVFALARIRRTSHRPASLDAS